MFVVISGLILVQNKDNSHQHHKKTREKKKKKRKKKERPENLCQLEKKKDVVDDEQLN